MNFPLFIAKRYCQSGTGTQLVQRIGLISMLSIALSTMALLLVLSAFNGVEDFVHSLFSAFYPDINITCQKGKRFVPDPACVARIKATPGVAKVVEVIEDNVMLRYGNHHMLATVKGVSDNFLVDSCLAPFVQEGSLQLSRHGKPVAILGIGLQYALAIRLNNTHQRLQIMYPNNIDSATYMPSQLYTCKAILPGAVFEVERQFDDHYVIVPFDFVAALMRIKGQVSALEIQIKPGCAVSTVQQQLKAFVPVDLRVLSYYEQQASLMRTIYIERLFVAGTLAFIVLVASLNMFFVLSMLVMDKRQDIAILYTLGATPTTIRNIFLLEGLLVAVVGAILGAATAWLLTWLQQKFGFVTLGTSTGLIEAYPIRRQLSDFIYTTIGVIIVALITAYRPAQLAMQTKVTAQL